MWRTKTKSNARHSGPRVREWIWLVAARTTGVSQLEAKVLVSTLGRGTGPMPPPELAQQPNDGGSINAPFLLALRTCQRRLL